MNIDKLLTLLILIFIAIPSNASSGCNNPEIDYPEIMHKIEQAIDQVAGEYRRTIELLTPAQTTEERNIINQKAYNLRLEFESLVRSKVKCMEGQIHNER